MSVLLFPMIADNTVAWSFRGIFPLTKWLTSISESIVNKIGQSRYTMIVAWIKVIFCTVK